MNLLTTLQPQYAAKVPVTTNTQTTYGAKDIKKEKRHETKVRAAALSGSVIGSGLFLLAMAKKASKGDFNYSKLMKVNFKNPEPITLPLKAAALTLVSCLFSFLISFAP